MPTPSIARRLASMLYESLLLTGVLGATLMLPYVLLGMLWQIEVPGALAWLHLTLVLGVYFIWLWQRNGQTLAMQTWRLRLTDAASGGRVSGARALLRYALCWPSLLCLGAGIVWALLDRDRQFLHDRLAGTRVVLTPASRGKP